jgi:hypothetical protein
MSGSLSEEITPSENESAVNVSAVHDAPHIALKLIIPRSLEPTIPQFPLPNQTVQFGPSEERSKSSEAGSGEAAAAGGRRTSERATSLARQEGARTNRGIFLDASKPGGGQ